MNDGEKRQRDVQTSKDRVGVDQPGPADFERRYTIASAKCGASYRKSICFVLGDSLCTMKLTFGVRVEAAVVAGGVVAQNITLAWCSAVIFGCLR